MINEKRELKKIERELARLVADVPKLKWIVEEQQYLIELKAKINSIAEKVENILNEEWANDIQALEKERLEFAPELTREEARRLFFSKWLSGAIFSNARELPADDGFILIVGLTIYILEKKDRLLRTEYERLALEYNQRLVTLFEEIDRERATGGEWIERLDELIGRRAKYERFSEQQIGIKIASATRLLGQAYYLACSSLTYYRLQEAIATKQFKKVPGEIWPTKKLGDATARGILQIRPIGGPEAIRGGEESDIAQSMFEQCEHLSDLDADVLDALFAFWQLQARSEGDSGVASVDHVLKLRGVRPKLGGQLRHGGFDRKQRDEIVASIDRLENIWIAATQPARGDRNAKLRSETKQSYLIVVSEREYREGALGHSEVRFVIFQPGAAFRGCLLGPARQVALVAAQTLRYNWRTHALEKRMSRYLSWQWRIRASRKEYFQPYKVHTLLDAIHLSVDDRNPSRTLNRFENLLERLKVDGVIDGWEYRELDDVVINRKKGWVYKWLETLVQISLPAAIESYYAEHINRNKS